MVTMTKLNQLRMNVTMQFNFKQEQFHSASKKGASSGHMSEVCPVIAFEIKLLVSSITLK